MHVTSTSLQIIAVLVLAGSNCLARCATTTTTTTRTTQIYHKSGPNGDVNNQTADCGGVIAPKVFITNLFYPEGEAWYADRTKYDVLAKNITVPGFSPLFPDVHCTADYQVCQLITGEGEINAATTMTALIFSPMFDLRKTYFLTQGIAGMDPRVGTIADVTLARFSVSVTLQYEFDPRDLPANFSTGFIPQGSLAPGQYPPTLYGTEVFEVNDALRQRAIDLIRRSVATTTPIVDSPQAAAYRALFQRSPLLPNGTNPFAAATRPPSVQACDTATSNVYWSGPRLNEAFGNFFTLITNGTSRYCTSQAEDSAVLEALLRGQLANRTDFARIIVMRTASNFVMPPPGSNISNFQNLEFSGQGYIPALKNIPTAGTPIIDGILRDWEGIYERGIIPNNYIGDIFGSLGGKKPDFGPGAIQEPQQLFPLVGKRDLESSNLQRQQQQRHDRGVALYKFTRKSQRLPRMQIHH